MSFNLKYNASRVDILNDISDKIEELQNKYASNAEAMAALDEIDSIICWWTNTPIVVYGRDIRTSEKPS